MRCWSCQCHWRSYISSCTLHLYYPIMALELPNPHHKSRRIRSRSKGKKMQISERPRPRASISRPVSWLQALSKSSVVSSTFLWRHWVPSLTANRAIAHFDFCLSTRTWHRKPARPRWLGELYNVCSAPKNSSSKLTRRLGSGPAGSSGRGSRGG